MVTHSHSETAFESANELDVLAKGYVTVDKAGFHRERAIFPEVTLAFIRETQPREFSGLAALQAAAERTMALLKERRAALVAAAVSSSIKVSTCASDVGLAAVV